MAARWRSRKRRVERRRSGSEAGKAGSGGGSPWMGLASTCFFLLLFSSCYFINCCGRLDALINRTIYRDLEGEVDRLDRLRKLILPASQKFFVVV